MTVGISLNNGLEAIIITDSRVSKPPRKSDSIDKMGPISSKNYSGAIFGTGYSIWLEGILKNIEKASKKNPEGTNESSDDNTNKKEGTNLNEFVQNLEEMHRKRVNNYDDSFINSVAKEIEKKSKIFQDLKKRESFLEKKSLEFINEYDQNKKADTSSFAVIAYDKIKEKIRTFRFDNLTNIEVYSNHLELGSGGDGANLYLSNKLQGLDIKELNIVDLAFFSVNAYSNSTVNQGVGGTPKIATLSKGKLEILPTEKTIALTNVSGSYLSEFPKANLDYSKTRNIFSKILSNHVNYASIAKKLDMTENALKTMYIPYSSWQERVNRESLNIK